MSTKYDFTSWLETKNPDEPYRFTDSCGNCLMGQYMTSKGESWSFSRYNEYVKMVLGDHNEVLVLSALPQTMGAALARVKRMKVLEDA